MRSILTLLLILTLGLQLASAQSPDAKDSPWVVPLTVSAAPLPKPALKYLLLPDLREQQPGNQIPAFYKCFMEQSNLYQNKEAIDKREQWLKAPLADLALEPQLVGYGGASTRQADYAARLDRVDWAIISQFKKEGVFLLLPDVQGMRNLAQVLQVKLRGEIARKEYDTAVHTAQTLLSLAHTFESHPTLIGSLVGMAIAALTLDTLQELAQQPGAPNLFWALTELPAPFMSMYISIQGERLWLSADFDVLGLPEPLSDAQLKKLAAQLNPLADRAKPKTALEWYQDRAANPKGIKAAIDRLASLGFPAEKLAKFSPLQVAMAADFMEYLVFRDDSIKWANLPLWKIPTGTLDIKPPVGILSELTPASIKVKQAQARVQQRIDVLRIVEAVRAHAATAGKLPGSLDEIELPLPIDAVSGKPYEYALKDGKAVVRGATPSGRANDRTFNRVVEISLQK